MTTKPASAQHKPYVSPEEAIWAYDRNQATITELTAALREIIDHKKYEGFGDVASRLGYCTQLAMAALQRAEGKS